MERDKLPFGKMFDSCICPLDTGRKLNGQLKFKKYPGCLLSVFYTLKFTSCVQVKPSTSLQHKPEAIIQSCTVKKVFLEILQISQESTCARVSFFNKFASLRPATLLKKRLWHKCFPDNFVKFLRTLFS